MSRDTHLHVQFYMRTEEDPAASREAGYAMFREAPYVRIRYIGDPTRELHCSAHARDKQAPREVIERWREKDSRHPIVRTGKITPAERWPDQWARFLEGRAVQDVGTPLAEAHFLTESKREELRAAGIRNVEALADAPDSTVRKRMGWRELREAARALLEERRGAAPVVKLAAENEELRSRLEQLEKLISKSREEGARQDTSEPTGEPGAEEALGAEEAPGDDAAALRARLDEMGVSYDRRLGVKRLRDILESGGGGE